MPRKASALPADLEHRPFALPEALAAGASRRQLERADLTIPLHGTRAHGHPRTILERGAVAVRVLSPGCMLSHATAARLLGLPLPRRLENDDRPIDVISPRHEPQVRRRGVTGHRGSELRTLVRVHGLPVTSAPDVWLDLANDLSVDELVVLGDAVVGSSAERLAALEWLVGRSRGIRGVRTAREALALIRIGSRSPRETMARLLLTRGGLPMPELNVDISDAAGGWIANVDFAWREQMVIAEYDGAIHDGPAQRKRDSARRRLLSAEDWSIVVLTSGDIPARADQVVEDLRRMLTARSGYASRRGHPSRAESASHHPSEAPEGW